VSTAGLILAAVVAATPAEQLEAWRSAAEACDASRAALVTSSSVAAAQVRELRLAAGHADAAMTIELKRSAMLREMLEHSDRAAESAERRATRAERLLVWAAMGIVLAGVGGLVAGLVR
jgi:hypothetical protein